MTAVTVPKPPPSSPPAPATFADLLAPAGTLETFTFYLGGSRRFTPGNADEPPGFRRAGGQVRTLQFRRPTEAEMEVVDRWLNHGLPPRRPGPEGQPAYDLADPAYRQLQRRAKKLADAYLLARCVPEFRTGLATQMAQPDWTMPDDPPEALLASVAKLLEKLPTGLADLIAAEILTSVTSEEALADFFTNASLTQK